MAIVNRRQLRGRRRLTVTAERLLLHLVAVAPIDSAEGLAESGIPASRAWPALVALTERGYVRAEAADEHHTVLHVTGGGRQHAEQMAGRAA